MTFKLVLLCLVGAQALEAQVSANPIRKVVTMLQDMQKKVEAEGEKEKALFDKFMCYCKNSDGDLQRSIDAAEKKVPELENNIKSAQGEVEQLKLDLTQAKTDREAAKAAMAEATALREKEAASFATEKAELETNVAAMGKAVGALEKGAGGAFLQTNAADVIRKVAQNADMMDADRDQVMSFLSGSNDYAPQSGQITGILKQMSDTMQATLAESVKGEEAAASSYQELMAAKTQELQALTSAIEEKSVRQGETAVSVVEMEGDLKDTAEALVQDKQFAQDLAKNCATKQTEWDEICKMRAEEQLALADTIKILNDDDALELFKKTVPAGSSLLQVKVTSAAVKANAIAVLREARKRPGSHHLQLDTIMLAITSKNRAQGFGFITKKIGNMIELLKKEQVDDDTKKANCEKLLKELSAKKADLERSIDDQEKANNEAADALETLKSELKALTAGIVALDKAVAEATEQRKAENEDYTQLVAQDSAAKEILGFAKNRLNKFYNPTQYKAPPKVEVEEAGAFVQVSTHSDDGGAPPPPPETASAYTKKSGQSSGVIGMIDTMINDLEKEMTEAKLTEKNSQEDYEADMKDSAAKRTADSKSIEEKEKAKAETEVTLQKGEEEKMAQFNRLMATDKTLTETKGDCEWLLENYEKRAEARTAEQASLKKDIEVLNGSED